MEHERDLNVELIFFTDKTSNIRYKETYLFLFVTLINQICSDTSRIFLL